MSGADNTIGAKHMKPDQTAPKSDLGPYCLQYCGLLKNTTR